MTKTILKSSVLALGVVLSAAGFAATTANSTVSNSPSNGVYVGVQGGYAQSDYSMNDINGDVSFTGDVDASSIAGRIYGGYNFNQYFATEMGFAYLPQIKFSNLKPVGYTGSDSGEITANEYAIDLALKASYPVYKNVTVFAKGGFADMTIENVKATINGQSVDTSDISSETKPAPLAGAGVSYKLTDNVSTDLSYTRYFSASDIEATNFYALGVTYNF